MKTCSKCKQEFPATTEYFRSNHKTLLRGDCRKCEYKRKVEYYNERPGQRQEEWKRYYVANKKYLNKKQREHRKKYPEAQRKSVRKRRALKLSNNHESYTEAQMLEKYGTDCYLCSNPIDMNAPRQVGKPGWEKGLHIEHVIAISNGGPDTLANVRPAHGLCNLNKSNKEIYEKN